MRSIFISIFLILTMGLWSQSRSVQGFVINDLKEPVFTGNVVAYSVNDSSYLIGDVISEGKWLLRSSFPDSILLKVSAMGYLPHWQMLTFTSSELKLDTIQLMPDALKEVEIRATLPVVQNKGNKLAVDVENSSLGDMGTAFEVLENTPGLTISAEGSVTVFGRGAAVVYLDGQRIPEQMLRSIPSNQIASVEIYKNPPASFDAQGRAVVNIITKKKSMEGYSVDLLQSITSTPEWYGFSSVNAYRRKNRMTVTGRLGYFRGDRWENTLYLRNFNEDSVDVSMRNEIEEDRFFPGNLNGGATVQFRPDSISHIDLSQSSSFGKTRFDIKNTNLITADTSSTTIATLRQDDGRNNDHISVLSYTRSLDTLGSELYVSASFTDYFNRKDGDISQNVASMTGTSSGDIRNTSENKIRFWVGQVNWTKCFDSLWKLESGVKFTQIENQSKVGLQRKSSGGDWVDDSSIVNQFRYNEQTSAGFLQGTYNGRKIFATAGVRTELTRTSGNSVLYGTSLIDTFYLNVFPMLDFTYHIIQDLDFNLDYAFSIERPSFQDLDPFIMYIDSLSYIKGNPALRPELIHDFSAELIYMEAASIGFNYAYTDNAMELFVERTGAGNSQFIGQTRNFNWGKTIGFNVAIPYQNKWWTTYNTAGYNRNHFYYNDGTSVAENNAEGWFFFIYNKFILGKRFSAELTGWYSTGGGEGLFMARPMSSVRVSALYRSLDGNLSVRLMVNDIFYTSMTRADSRIPGFDLYYSEAADSRYVRAVVTYRFGQVKQQGLDNRRNNEEERNRIKQ